MWYRDVIGRSLPDRRHLVADRDRRDDDCPAARVTECKPGSAMRALPGIGAAVVDDHGSSVPNGGGADTSFSPSRGRRCCAGSGGDQRRTEHVITRWLAAVLLRRGRRETRRGRSRVAARPGRRRHERVGPPDLHDRGRVGAGVAPSVAEAAVVGATDETTGQGIVAFVILRGDAADADGLVQELRQHVGHEIGPIAKPRQIMVVPELPKTRSGKIMRRLLRDVAENRSLGDVTTLADPTIMNLIQEGLGAGTKPDSATVHGPRPGEQW